MDVLCSRSLLFLLRAIASGRRMRCLVNSRPPQGLSSRPHAEARVPQVLEVEPNLDEILRIPHRAPIARRLARKACRLISRGTQTGLRPAPARSPEGGSNLLGRWRLVRDDAGGHARDRH